MNSPVAPNTKPSQFVGGCDDFYLSPLRRNEPIRELGRAVRACLPGGRLISVFMIRVDTLDALHLHGQFNLLHQIHCTGEN